MQNNVVNVRYSNGLLIPKRYIFVIQVTLCVRRIASALGGIGVSVMSGFSDLVRLAPGFGVLCSKRSFFFLFLPFFL